MKNEQRYDEHDLTAIQMSSLGCRMDANEAIAFARELEAVKTRTYDRKYPEFTALRIVPVSTEVNPGAESITYTQYDAVGMAKIISNYADDLPRADVKGKQFTSPVKGVGNSYGYSIQDIRAARMAGKPLEQRKASAARRAHDQTINSIAYNGDAENGLVGLFGHPNVTTYVLPADGTGSSATFKSKTPTQILRDLNGMVGKVIELTKGAEIVDTLLMTPDLKAYLSSTPRSDNSDTTILEYFLKNNGYINNVEGVPECKGAGAGGTDLIMMIRKDPDVLTLEIPQPFEQFPPQAKGLEFEIACHSRCGGVIIYYPLSLIKASGC